MCARCKHLFFQHLYTKYPPKGAKYYYCKCGLDDCDCPYFIDKQRGRDVTYQ